MYQDPDVTKRSPLPLLLLSLLSAGCLEYSLDVDDSNLGEDAGIPPREQDFIDGQPGPDACEQWGPDPTAEIAINDACDVTPSSGPLDAGLEWQILTFTSYGEYGQAVMTPLVGQLTDDNSDGRIDQFDVPDIVIITDDNGAVPSEGGVLRIIAGDASGELRSVFRYDLKEDTGTTQVYPYRYANAALGDLDGDGIPEIVTVARALTGPIEDPKDTGGSGEDTGKEGGGGGDSGSPGEGTDDPILPDLPGAPASAIGGEGCMLVAYTPELTVKWLARGADLPCGGHAPAIADLEGDGSVEVVIGPYIFEGASGALRAEGDGDVGRFRAYAEMGLHSIIVDLDGDGIQEVIAGRAIYGPQGQKICQGTEGNDGFTAAADLDMDGQGEFLVVGNGRALLMEADCSTTVLWELPGGGSGGPPTIADYDGDGFPEVGIADATTYSVYEADGTVLWSVPVTDASSHSTGSVVFDFEGDGYPEVVYGDEVSLWIFDGRDGSVRYQSDLHESRTLHEYPTIADIDGDGSAEIITVNGGSHYGGALDGLYVYGSDSDGWQGGRQVWNQHAYSITNINDDLSVPSPPTSNWPLYNSFRSGDVNPGGAGASPDAIPVAALCVEECSYGRAVIRVRVGNQGPVALRSGLLVAAYAERPDGSIDELARAYTSEVAGEGQASDIIELDIDLDRAGDDPVIVVVDANNATSECEEDNNTLRYSSISCE
ncbi:MAG: hypothetical protein ACI8S6_004587 [Myxococcota bacterium]